MSNFIEYTSTLSIHEMICTTSIMVSFSQNQLTFQHLIKLIEIIMKIKAKKIIFSKKSESGSRETSNINYINKSDRINTIFAFNS